MTNDEIKFMKMFCGGNTIIDIELERIGKLIGFDPKELSTIMSNIKDFKSNPAHKNLQAPLGRIFPFKFLWAILEVIQHEIADEFLSHKEKETDDDN